MTGPIAEMKSIPAMRRLHLNESPVPPSAGVVAAIAAAARTANRYPPGDDPQLLDALSEYCGAPADRIVLSSGSNELLHLLPLIAGAAGGAGVVVDPSFPTYRKVAGFFAMTVRGVPVTPDGRADVEAILKAIPGNCRLVCVASPNNPTGGRLTGEEIARLAAGVPDDVMLHFDEAYYEFGRQAGGPETLTVLETRKGPWIASRSFSKAFSLAGLRLGYSIAGDAALAERCRAFRPNFSVNVLAQAAGKAALAERGNYGNAVAAVASERQRLATGLRGLGFEPIPSAANFVSFPVPLSLPDLAPRLERAGILIAPFSLPNGVPAVRVTVGRVEDTDALLGALEAIGRT